MNPFTRSLPNAELRQKSSRQLPISAVQSSSGNHLNVTLESLALVMLTREGRALMTRDQI
jgi:hypothetical protein